MRGGDDLERLYFLDDNELEVKRTELGEDVFVRSIKRYEFVKKFIKPGDTVLDCACGSGYGSKIISDAGAGKVTGVDLDPVTIEYAKKHYGKPNIEFIAKDMRELTFKPNSFDVVVSIETIEHITQVDDWTKTMYNLCKPGGMAIISTPISHHTGANPHNHFHVHEFTKEDFEKLMEKYFDHVEYFIPTADDMPIQLTDKHTEGLIFAIAKKRKDPFTKIGEKVVGQERPAFVIAEAGVNHNGDMQKAKQLIDSAKQAGADAIKFQTFKTEKLITKEAPKAAYQDVNVGAQVSQYDMLKQLELNKEQFHELRSYALQAGIMFLSTPYDKQSVDLLDELSVDGFKIASADIVNHDLLEHVAAKNKPMILSTGMATFQEVQEAVSVIAAKGQQRNLVLLQCESQYPAKTQNAHVNTIDQLKSCGTVVGYSDHTTTPHAAYAAIAKGAKVYECHFTLDKQLPGPDHSASRDPQELKELIAGIRLVEQSLGSTTKIITEDEQKNIHAMRRSIVAETDIAPGTTITAEMLGYKRPGDGLYPTKNNIGALVGKQAKVMIPKDVKVTVAHVE